MVAEKKGPDQYVVQLVSNSCNVHFFNLTKISMIFFFNNADIVLLLGAWKEEANDKSCPNNHKNNTNVTQIECQNLCKQNSACVGISYSTKLETLAHNSESNCYICKDDELERTANEFGFYRREGKAYVENIHRVVSVIYIKIVTKHLLWFS